MTVGERIKARRKALHISADELAAKIGVSRSTMFRYENGDIEKLPGDILVPIALHLNTTPAYLMGWSKTENALDIVFPSNDSEKSEKDEALLDMFHKLNDEGKEQLLDFADSLVKSGKFGEKDSKTKVV